MSVIIPTYQRPRLVVRAVCSALGQSYREIEIIVVIDGADDFTKDALEAIQDERLRVFETGCNQGPAAARNYGVKHACGDLISILDDDDEWTHDKIAEQVAIARHLSGEFLITCRTVVRNLASGRETVLPNELYEPDSDLGEYLFDRATPFRRPGLIASGTLLFPRMLALRVPFPNSVQEDWSWLLQCITSQKVPVYWCDRPMFIYNLDPQPSRNLGTPWRLSLDWGLQHQRMMSPRALAGLLSSATVWRAKRQEGIRACYQVARHMRKDAQPTLWHWIMLIGVAALPLRLAETLRQLTFRWGAVTVEQDHLHELAR